MTPSHRICPLHINEKEAVAVAPAWTYSQLDSLANRAAHSLGQRGLKKGDCIALYAIPDWQTIALLFAAWRLSLIVALIAPHHPSLQTILQPINLRLWIDDPLPFFSEGVVEERTLDLSAPALLLLTSGSTGIPKWAAFTLNQLFYSAETMIQALSAKMHDRWLLNLPLHHVGGLGVLLRSICSCGSIVLPNKNLSFSDRLLSARAQFASLVPTQLYRLLQDDFSELSTHLLIGGGPLSKKLHDHAIQKGCHLSLTYGLTEMSSTVCLASMPVWNEHAPYLGHPLPGRQVKITDGELHVSGKCLFEGYGNPPKHTSEWFATGDIGTHHPQYGVSIHGRKDFQFICGGENIQPEEIEIAILSHPNVEQAIVVPQYDEEYGARPIAFVQSTASEQSIQSYLSDRLPRYKIPIRILSMPEIQALKPNRKYLTALANN